MQWLVGIGIGLVVTWAVLVLLLFVARPEGGLVRESLRLLPDLIRLLRGLATDRGLPRGARIRLWLALLYLASPIDLVPDFIPVIGFADDAIIVALVLRSIVRRAGMETVRRHWHGSEVGFSTIMRFTGRDHAAS